MLDKVEQIMTATTGALQKLGLSGFRVELSVYDHYDSKSWQVLADEGCHKGYKNTPLESIRSVQSGVGKTETGETRIVIFTPINWQPSEPDDIILEHSAELEKILA